MSYKEGGGGGGGGGGGEDTDGQPERDREIKQAEAETCTRKMEGKNTRKMEGKNTRKMEGKNTRKMEGKNTRKMEGKNTRKMEGKKWKMKNKVQLGQRSHTHTYIYINISAVSQTSHQSYHVCLQGENLKSNGSCKGGREKLKQAGSKHRAPKRQQRQNYSLQDTKHLHTRAYNKAVHYNQPSMTHLPYNASTRTLTWGKTDRRFGTCIHLKQSTRWKCWSSSNH